jgi:hypothetical protein
MTGQPRACRARRTGPRRVAVKYGSISMPSRSITLTRTARIPVLNRTALQASRLTLTSPRPRRFENFLLRITSWSLSNSSRAAGPDACQPPRLAMPPTKLAVTGAIRTDWHPSRYGRPQKQGTAGSAGHRLASATSSHCRIPARRGRRLTCVRGQATGRPHSGHELVASSGHQRTPVDNAADP